MDNEIYHKLFDLIKNHKWDEFKNLLKLNKDIDVNIRDNQNEYLLSYAILYNNIDTIKVLVDYGAKIDILDNEERSILYSCIKYGYTELINYFVKKNNDTIGINILDIKDRLHKISLHYAIQKKNKDIIKLLLENGSNTNIQENNGYNALHIAVFTRDIEICKLVIKYIGNINSKCNTGETALHLSTNLRLFDISKLLIDNNININITDTLHEFSALHYICSTNQIELLKYILSKEELKNKININIQDIFGNTCLHYALIEQNYGIINQLIENKNINFNLWNIDGKIPLHLILENYEDRYDYLLDIIIDKSNLSIKDNEGNNSLFYLINLDLWKKYKNILEKKKIDIYATNKKSIMMLDIIKDKDKEEFINMIVSSYYKRLKLKPDLWKNDWENVCSKDYDENNEIKKILKKDINNNTDFEKECTVIIKKNLLKNLEKIKSGEKDCNISSYPLTKNKVCIYLEEGENLSVCTFTGNTIDILLGLIYLLKKYKDVCSTLTTDFTENKNIQDFYKSIGILMNDRSDFLNFEIIWASNKLYLVEDFYDKVKKCILKGSKFIIIPLGIEMKEGSHANYIIYDIEKNIIERFEPHGSTTPPGLNYNPQLLDNILESRFKEINEKNVYLKPKNYLPKISFQLLDILETKKKKIGDPGGFCALWAIWYVDMRLSYRDIPSDILVKKLIKSIKINNISVKNMIRNYAINVIKLRDEILNHASLNINDWINDEYTDEQLQMIINKIKEIIVTTNIKS
jgi:ankyrin repeat protein